MKTNAMILSGMAALLVFLVSFGFAAEPDSCEAPGRNARLCRDMRHLRSHVSLMDAGRDLMQLDFAFLETLGASIEQNVSKILLSSSIDDHLKALKGVREAGREVAVLARSHDPQVLKAANSVRAKCLSCHSQQAPSSGLSWTELSGESWDSVLTKCNSVGRNPYTCKSMHAMLMGIQFLEAAERSGKVEFGPTGAVASEIARIASDLFSKDLPHGPRSALIEVESRAKRVAALSSSGDPEAFEGAATIREACMTCHGSGTPGQGNSSLDVRTPNRSWLERARLTGAHR